MLHTDKKLCVSEPRVPKYSKMRAATKIAASSKYESFTIENFIYSNRPFICQIWQLKQIWSYQNLKNFLKSLFVLYMIDKAWSRITPQQEFNRRPESIGRLNKVFY